MINKERIPEIEILRGISALAVISIHVTAYFTRVKELNFLKMFNCYLDNASSFAVPSFIFISGLALYKNYSFLDEKYLTFVKKRFSKILPIYILFSFFYIVLVDLYNFANSNDLLMFHPISIVYKLCTGGAYFHLWYFGILFQFYLLYPIILKLYKFNKNRLLILSFFLQWAYTFFVGDNFLNLFDTQTNYTIPLFFGYIFWFVFGFYFLENKEKIVSYMNLKVGFFLIIVINCIRILPSYYGLQLYSYDTIPKEYFALKIIIDPFFYLIEILFFYKISMEFINQKESYIANFFEKVGSYSLEIYLIHAFVLIVLEKLFLKIGLDPEKEMFYPLIWLGTVLLSFLFAILYRRIPIKIAKFKFN